MLLDQVLLRLSQVSNFIRKTKTPLPLILDLARLQRSAYIAENDQGHRIRIRPRTGERFAFYENLTRLDYLQHGVALRHGDSVIDIGANIGCFTVLAASLVGASGRVIALEPDPQTYAQLCSNIELNNLSNVTAVNAAVGATNSAVSLYVSRNSLFASIHSGLHPQAAGACITVNGRTLDSLMDEMSLEKVDLLKVDCEGAEYEILASLTSDMAAGIKQISMEVHDVPGHDFEELAQRLTALGFRFKNTYPLVAWRT